MPETNIKDPLARKDNKQRTVAKEQAETCDKRYQRKKMEVDGTHLEERSNKHYIPGAGMEPTRKTEEGKTKNNVEAHNRSGAPSQQHVMESSQDHSTRPDQVESSSVGPMFH